MPEFKLQDAIDELVETAKNFTIIPTLLNRTKQGYKEKMLELKSRDEVSVKEAQELYNMSLLVESAEKNIADGKSNYEKYKNEIISYLKTMPGITITSDKNRHQSKIDLKFRYDGSNLVINNHRIDSITSIYELHLF